MSAMDCVEDLARKWLHEDRDPATREEIQTLVTARNHSELELRLRHPIAFGTAGLRAAMGAGYARMNALTVLRASHGLAQYIKARKHSSASATTEQLKVVIGYDARYNSEKFARLAAAAFLDHGFEVLWFGRLVHTPMVPFTVNFFKADAGVMVTASHNPKNDNGYKVYWNNGCQIIPPHDTNIAAEISRVENIETWDGSQIDRHQKSRMVFRDASTAYYQSIQNLVPATTPEDPITPFVYTPMHGVGLPFMQHVADSILRCSKAMHVVEAQAQPDPDFTTVPFPNPEEQGATDLAKADADKVGCSLILANDPDADRFAAAERLETGEWHQFTGNQMGVLLASYILDSYTGDRKKTAMLASTVSSGMLAAIAAKNGFYFEETLTGFKWLGNVAQKLQPKHDVLFAYEEAIGYMFPTVVWDKDGVAAAAVFLTASSFWHSQGLTPWTKLQQMYQTYGYFEDANTYLISPSPDTTNRVFNDIRKSNNGGRPERIGSRAIHRWRDLTTNFDSGTETHRPVLPPDPTAQMITCELGDVVFTARGSGTEPKIKLYIEAQADSSEAAKASANEVLRDLLSEWFKPKYGLKLAGT